MANGLMDLSNLLGQSSNAQSGGLLGGGVFSQPETRGARRSRLLSEAIAGAGQNPYARLGASFGGLLGMGGRAAAEATGLVDAPEEVQRNKAIRQVQEEVKERGLDPMADPSGFGEYVTKRFSDLGFTDLALRTQVQLQQMAPEPEVSSRVVQGGTDLGNQIGLAENESAVVEFTGDRISGIKDRTQQEDDPQKSTQRIVGGTNRANALAQRFPEIGQLQEGEEAILEFEGGRIVGINTRRPREEEDDTPSRIKEYTEAIERGLIDPEQVSFTDYNATRAGGDSRETVPPTDTRIKPFLDTIEGASELDDQISSIAPGKDPAQFAGINIPFTGSKDVDTTRREVAIRAAEIREQDPQLTFRDAVQAAIDELSQQVGISVPQTSGGSTGGSDPFSNVTE